MQKLNKHQIMGNLPPFSRTLKTRESVISNQEKETYLQKELKGKAWIMLIVCFLTGACHPELVPGLTANAFIKAFENFTNTI